MITDKDIKKGLDEAYHKAGQNAYFGNGFKAGVKFAVEFEQKNNKQIQTDTLWVDPHQCTGFCEDCAIKEICRPYNGHC